MNSARVDFDRARRQAIINGLISALTRRQNRMPSFEEIEAQSQLSGHSSLGVQQVPLARIVGSLGRSRDFDREFRPRQEHTRDRWQKIYVAGLAGQTLPPVSLYKVGDTYFVEDGNHRVSVARFRGAEFIDAEVVEYAASVQDSCAAGSFLRFEAARKREVTQPSSPRTAQAAHAWIRPRLRTA
jgi:hypothetical protein